MKLAIIVSTTGHRVSGLNAMLRSIDVDCQILIAFDGMAKFEEPVRSDHIEVFKDSVGSVACRNALTQQITDEAILYVTDDLVFVPGAIKIAIDTMNFFFPDGDGVVGFCQKPNNYHPSGVALVGNKFFKRYPRKQLFCPDYYHFAAQEVFDLSSRVNKFASAPNAILIHNHLWDKTAEMARVHKQADIQIKFDRKSKGQIWGM